ncbi:MAG: PQQ-binding-like beta-propeller repeat protein [Myxococcales bacterium]|nr:PQQ-binding-like beta-propeller repeat protein [Myxococcales bacterium]MCB9709517.1 PQQ-binding-like beta-propeller repeat protein [Myxococcales bacterium]
MADTYPNVVPPNPPDYPESQGHEKQVSRLGILLGVHLERELPNAAELASGLLALARGVRQKVILPLADSTAEFTLVRRGQDALVSHYDAGSVPNVYALDQALPLRDLLDACAENLQNRALATTSESHRKIAQRLAHRLRHAVIVPSPCLQRSATPRSGATVNTPNDAIPLAFSFEALIPPGIEPLREASSRADVHATLFRGKLWVHSRGQKLLLVDGPILPAVQRMVDAARALLDASETQRPVNFRLRSNDFAIGARFSERHGVALTFHPLEQEPLTVPSLDVSGATLPILRLASIVLRAVVSVDRNQARNLRISSLRDHVRRLRKLVRTREKVQSFINKQPERLRLATSPESERPPTVTALPVSHGQLRFKQRWNAEIEGLDAGSTFLCGDRLVAATPRYTLALSREDGEILWAHPTSLTTAMMTGKTLVRLGINGEVELCEVEHGEVYARGYIAPRVGGPAYGMLAGGGTLPPVAILAEGQNRLVAIDLRTGEPRWRFVSPAGTMFQMSRLGRVLVVVCGDSAVHALDVGSGEVVWRFSQPGRFCMKPYISAESAFVVTSEAGGERGTLYGLDLYSGKMRWNQELEGSPLAPPVAGNGIVTVPFLAADQRHMASFEMSHGQMRWCVADPGLGQGGSALQIDNRMIINAPTGNLTALDSHTGEIHWTHKLSDPASDDIPRQLDPVLRGGALFVPSSSVYTVRPADGCLLGEVDECDLVPDFLRVDERSWLYVAEESGHIAAFAPAAQLYLVR